MKKLILLSILGSIAVCGLIWGAPVIPPALPKPVYYTQPEIFNNVFSSDAVRTALKLYVDCTLSTVTVNVTGDIINVVASSDTKIHDQLDKQYILISTGTDQVVAKQDKTFLLISTGTDKVVSKLDRAFIQLSTATDQVVAKQDKTYVLISTGTDQLVAKTDKTYVLVSTGNDTVVSRLDNLSMYSSTGTDQIVAKLDKQYVLISTNADGRYLNKVSSGTTDLLTALYTTFTINIDIPITGWSFLYKSTDPANILRIKPSIFNTTPGIPLFNSEIDSENIEIPTACNFVLTGLLVGDTVQYVIKTVR